MMKRQAGFTLLEILVSVAIVGILSATAVPVYKTWQQRAYGSEASIMRKQILDAEIMYFLDHDEFYPPKGEVIDVLHGYNSNHPNIKDIYDKLNITIPTNHFLDYYFTSYDDDDGIYSFHLSISSLGQRFDILKGVSYIAYKMDKYGNVTTTEFEEPWL